MKTCFLIVNYNDFKSTKHLIDNIIDYNNIDEIVIVDNCSIDIEKEKLKNIKHKKIHIIFNDENGGYSKAINIGARYLSNKYDNCNLIISNSDIVIMGENDIDKLLEILNYDSVGVVIPQIIELGNIFKGRRCVNPYIDFFKHCFVFRKIFNKILTYPDNYFNTNESLIEVINTCFFLIKLDTLKKINYMDENLFLYYEAEVLSKKLTSLGLMTLVCNKVKVKHNYSISVDKNINSVDKYITYKNSQIYYDTTYCSVNKFWLTCLKFSKVINVCFIKVDYFFRKMFFYKNKGK